MKQFTIILLLVAMYYAPAFSQTYKEMATVKEMAAKGDPASQFQLGVAYYYGEGAPLDMDMGMAYLRKSADNGYDRAQFEIGMILFELGANAEAKKYLEPVADDFPLAAEKLAEIFEKGLGTKKDPEQARKYRRMAN